ncbi:cytochrome P450 [Mycena rebaudengoi]|nr:cytochrome P450 [Mycena rebaudengoi]
MDSPTLALGAFTVTVCLGIIHRLGRSTPLPLIPHNKLRWFIGDIPFLTRIAKEKGAISYAFDDTAVRLGPLSQVVIGLGQSCVGRLFGFGQVIVVLADAQEIQDVLSNRASEFDRPEYLPAFVATLPQGMITLPTGEQLKHHKRWLGMTMTSPYLARMTPRIVGVMQELVNLWHIAAKRLGTEGSPDVAFNAFDDLRLAAIDVITSITFGTSFNGVQASLDYLEANPSAAPSSRPVIPKLVTDIDILADTIGDGFYFPAPRLLPWLTRNFNRKWRNAINSTHDFLRRRLYAARADYALEGRDTEKPAASKADNVLEMILEREREDSSRGVAPLSEAEIIDELLSIALGGGTSGAAMQWSIKILCKHPDVQRKLRSELLNKLPAIASRLPTYAEISDESNLPYLNAVMYEILRCSRPAPAVIRDAKCDTVLLGYPIPKGTQVLMPLGMIQQMESDGSKDVTDGLHSVRSASSNRGRKTGYWSSSDVHLFNPERWLRQDGSFNANAGPWLPFSYGPRGCFGQKLAFLELRLFLAMIFNFCFFDALPEDINTWKSHESVTHHPAQCYARPIVWEDIQNIETNLVS